MRPVRDDGLEDLVAQLDEPTLRDLLADAALRDEATARAVRLAAAGPGERLSALRREVDDTLRTRRHMGYQHSAAWASDTQPLLAALAQAVETEPTAELVDLLQRAAGLAVKVILHSDDSHGMIGDVAVNLLDLHARACDAGVGDPTKLAKWMVKFRFVDQDFFELDPVRYATALGDKGIATYRREVDKRTTDPAEFAARYAAERLAVLDRNVPEIIRLHGGNLAMPYHYQRVAEALLELGLEDDALAWARDGIEKTSGWQVGKLYDLVADIHATRNDDEAVFSTRLEHHESMPTSTTYARFRAAAESAGRWGDVVDRARSVLGDRDPGGLVDALLSDEDPDEAWTVATGSDVELDDDRWKRLAEAREPTHPADALTAYLQLVDTTLVQAERRAYKKAVRLLTAAKRAADAADDQTRFDARVAELREIHRRRPSLITMLDKAGFR